LEIPVSFLGIHKWKPDIYIGFSPALHFALRKTIFHTAGKNSLIPHINY
jgi:hypothetical protein